MDQLDAFTAHDLPVLERLLRYAVEDEQRARAEAQEIQAQVEYATQNHHALAHHRAVLEARVKKLRDVLSILPVMDSPEPQNAPKSFLPATTTTVSPALPPGITGHIGPRGTPGTSSDRQLTGDEVVQQMRQMLREDEAREAEAAQG